MEAGCIKTKANEFAQQDIDPWLKMHKKFLCLYVYCSVVNVTLPNEDLITKRACGHNNYGSLGQIISYFDASLQIPRKVRACCLFFNVCPFLSNQPFFMFVQIFETKIVVQNKVSPLSHPTERQLTNRVTVGLCRTQLNLQQGRVNWSQCV